MQFASYEAALEWLYSRLPMFTRIGPAAFKKDLTNTLLLCGRLGNPHHRLRCIHIAGTNGKGSVAHMLAAIFQKHGYRTGLYTSPHLVDFTERIRINGQQADKQFVKEFAERAAEWIEEIQPSFFEMTVAMAFEYFAQNQVDIAIVETGLGGRLDSTNIIDPELSIITGIGYDHMNMLGDTLEQIAFEKAGIIKPTRPVVLGKGTAKVEAIFLEKAIATGSDVYKAAEMLRLERTGANHGQQQVKVVMSGTTTLPQLDLLGEYQLENAATAIAAAKVLQQGWHLDDEVVLSALGQVKALTGLRGRFEVVSQNPLIVFDVAHNEEGLVAVLAQTRQLQQGQLRIVYGSVRDKDVAKMARLLPKDAEYYIAAPNVPRGLPVEELLVVFQNQVLNALPYPSVAEAFVAAHTASTPNDTLLATGSFFVVGEAMECL